MPYPLIIDMSIHHFDMMRYFLASDPVSIYGRSWNPPWSWYKGDASAAVSLEFANSTVVTYDCSWCSTGVETPWNGNWRFECENGVILLHDDQVFTQYRADVGTFTNTALTKVEPIQVEHTPQAHILHEFVRAVTGDYTPSTTCQDNIRSLSIVFDTVRSFEAEASVASSQSFA